MGADGFWEDKGQGSQGPGNEKEEMKSALSNGSAVRWP